MPPWQQNYDPLHSWLLSTLISSLPLATLFFFLLILKRRVWQAALVAMLAALVCATAVYRMPLYLIGTAAFFGIVIGWLRVAWIIVASIYLYNIAVETGQFRIMKDSIAGVTADKRVQLILVAFCFGAFLEGTGSGGAPIAIVGALLVGLGFPRLQAAKICLLANTVPLAWGGIGNPLRVLSAVTGFSVAGLSAMNGRILPFVSALLPFWLVLAVTGWRKTREVLPAVIVSGLTFAVAQYFVSNFGPSGLVDVASAACSLFAMIVLLRFWKPPSTLPSGNEGDDPAVADPPRFRRYTSTEVLRGWSSFLFASVSIFILGIPGVSEALSFSVLRGPVPFLHNAVLRVPPVVPVATPDPAIADLNVVAMHGTAVFVGAVLAARLLGMSFKRAVRIFRDTVRKLVPSLLGVSFMVGFLFVLRYSGILTVMGISFTHAGAAYPFWGPFMGWLGVALTGSDSTSNLIFGHLQASTARRLGVNPLLMAASNSAGGVMGKLMDPQSILVSSTTTQQAGNEGEIFKTVFKHAIMLTALVGVITFIHSLFS